MEEETSEGIEEAELDEMWSYVGKKALPAMVMARYRPPDRKSPSLCICPAKRRSLSEAQKIIRAVWY